MIREFETAPGVGPEGTILWSGKISVDLAWVASASPWGNDDGTQITLCGDSWRFAIKYPYADFMKLWTEAKNP